MGGDSARSPERSATSDERPWAAVAYAVALGVFGALTSLVFMGLIEIGGLWYDDDNTSWFDGHWWWVLLTTGAGVLVGLLHRLTRLPSKTSGLIEDLQAEHVEARHVPGIAAVSAVSLIGGASLGPEKALGSIGGGVAGWVSRRNGLSEADTKTNTLTGFAGSYGGLFSSTLIVVGLIIEVARPGGRRLTKALLNAIVASSVSFGIYFAIAGAVFLDAYSVPKFEYKDWQLLAGIGLGLFAAVVTTILGLIIRLMSRLTALLKNSIARAAVGGFVFGVIGVMLPLTMFTGSDQLKTVVHDASALSIGFLVALLLAKMCTFAVCQASGFVGGAVFPALFMGGTAGVLVHAVFPDVPLGLAVSCMLAAVPGALIAAPFSMVLMSSFLTEVGALQTAPMLIAVITSHLSMEGVKTLLAHRRSVDDSPA